MSWFRSKGPTQGEVKAYQMGQEASAEMATPFKVYQEQRFGPVHNNYLGVLRDCLQSALKGEDKPPLLVCRADMQVFEDNVNLLRTQMLDEKIKGGATPSRLP